MNTTEEQQAIQYELFKEVAESNLERFYNSFKNQVFDYRALNTHKITKVLTEEEVRQLAINFFVKSLVKLNFEYQEQYFDKKLIVKN